MYLTGRPAARGSVPASVITLWVKIFEPKLPPVTHGIRLSFDAGTPSEAPTSQPT